MATTHNTTTRNNLCSTINTDVASAGVIRVLAGATPLVDLAMSSGAFGTPANGQMTANPISTGVVTASGTATLYELRSNTRTVVLGSVSVNGGGGDLQFDDVNFVIGGNVDITSFLYAAPV